ncbi:unnamed protein product [Ostreobium quekettii]|uniref:Uncharacterized protein n=1 Tax=Ostreobium quekettii TaxID=121088 RepID=A0A8S1ISC5_9CHLO|nr:unnamed protein product [Ostreobium quekettii]
MPPLLAPSHECGFLVVAPRMAKTRDERRADGSGRELGAVRNDVSRHWGGAYEYACFFNPNPPLPTPPVWGFIVSICDGPNCAHAVVPQRMNVGAGGAAQSPVGVVHWPSAAAHRHGARKTRPQCHQWAVRRSTTL